MARIVSPISTRPLSLTLNGEPVNSGSEIRDGDEFRIGDSEVVLHFYPCSRSSGCRSAGAHEKLTSRRLSKPLQSNRQPPPGATMPRCSCASSLVSWCARSIRAPNWSLSQSRSLSWAACSISASRCTKSSSAAAGSSTSSACSSARCEIRSLKTNEQIVNIDESNKQIQYSLSLAVKLRSEYGSGVCLIAGSYYFVEAGTGRPLRYAEAQLNDSGGAVQSGSAPEALTPEGNAAIAEYEFVGTGFHVGQGYVLTNRHIAQPWIADDRAQSISGSLNAQPRLRKLIAYFPNITQAIPLKFKGAAQRDDLAVCSLDIRRFRKRFPICRWKRIRMQLPLARQW